MPSIHTKAEEVKKQLSASDTVEFSCLMPGKGEISDYNFEKIILTMERQRDFLDGCRGLFDRSLLPVTRLLGELGKAIPLSLSLVAVYLLSLSVSLSLSLSLSSLTQR